MVETGVKDLIVSSTCATYGVPQTVPIAEDHPQAPINPYGESKLMFERAVRWYGEIRGLCWVSQRYFNAAGADLDGELVEHHEPETHLIPVAIRAALGGDPLMIMGSDYPTFDGTAVRDFVHVADLADAHVKALQYIDRGGPSAAFNLGTGNGHSVLEVVAAVERVSGRAVPYKLGARRQGDPAVLVADASRVRAATGWQPTHSRLDLMVETALVGQEQLLRVETETISLPAASPLPQVMPAAIEAPVAVQAAAGLAQIE
jgi:UDP-glucose-4-epimerase GalE